MSLISRLVNVFRADRVNTDIDEELACHLEEAVANGRDPDEARRALGNRLRLREDSRDARVACRLDALRADVVFAFRQIRKSRLTAASAIVSLALAIGACTSAFRLIDALLLRPLPVSDPERLYVVSYQMKMDGKVTDGDAFEYPLFRSLRNATRGAAELVAISYPRRTEITWDEEPERASLQYISGSAFGTFGLRPARGRLLTESDDQKPGAHPFAVISWDYWKSRFGGDERILGRSFRNGNDVFQIVGVAPEGFTGTEPGTLTDVFLPMMANAKAIDNKNWAWFRTWIRVQPGDRPEQVREQLQAAARHYRADQAGELAGRMPADRLQEWINPQLRLEPASAGFSGLQKQYRRSLWILGGMVALLLLIACVNVANLMMAQGAARARELALRVSIGAGRARLIQMMLIESATLALCASVLGALFAWWAAPFVVSLISAPDNPTRLVLPADWRVTTFAAALALGVTFLFGLVPALRASSVRPASTLKGGEEAGGRHRLMHSLAAAQVAFCFVVYFAAGLFVSSFERMTHQPLGFDPDRLLVLDITSTRPQPPAFWEQARTHVRSVGGVQSASLALWPLLGHSIWRTGITIDGRDAGPGNPYLLTVSPEFFETMRIPLLGGRAFRSTDKAPSVAIVTESFARQYLDGADPVGRTFERMLDKTQRISTNIVGYVRDVRYADMREAPMPVIFMPVNAEADKGTMYPKESGSLLVRTKGDPLALAAALRREVPAVRPEFRVSNVTTQNDIAGSHTVRERLLATLSLFFATVALVLAGVGLYGVLNYSVLQRRREIGIRVALGARPAHIARRVTSEVLAVLATGSAAGLALGIASERYVETLLYQITTRDVSAIAVPVITIVGVALLAATPPVIRAIRIDPAMTLKAD